MADELEERLMSHAQAFEGLMSLIPAKHYYGQDTSDQWQRKKQTKAEKKAAKRAKLDPENIQTARDVMEENERKRKRELEGDDDISDGLDAPGKERPREGLKLKEAKKPKLDTAAAKQDEEAEEDDDARRKREERQKRIQERREKKKQKQQEKAQTKKTRKGAPAVSAPNPDADEEEMDKSTTREVEQDDEVSDAAVGEDEIEKVDISGMVDEDQHGSEWSSVPPSPLAESPASSTVPSASSSSSIVPPTTPGKIPKVPHVDQELKARLQARLEALRAQRKADGIDGKPARNRQELMEARRRKEEQRRQHKKELRKQVKEDEQRKAAEAELARLRGSGSPGTPDIFSPREPENNFSFGRITFDDGQQLDTSASNLLDQKKKKGRSDPKTALEAAEKKRQRLAALDEEKRTEIESKDQWLNAKKRAHGEKVRDDTSLLKKTLKRKEKTKHKSESEWAERTQSVQKGKVMRQKKREENLRKRRDEKGSKPGKKSSKAKVGKKKARPGFEGSFRSKAK